MRATRISLGILLLAALAGLAAPLGAAGGLGQVVIASIEPQGKNYPFPNTVFVSVADTEGMPILDLSSFAFSVLENETKVQVAVSPYTATLHIGIVFDTSKSMTTVEGGKRRVDQAKDVATALVDPNNRRLQLGDKVAIFAFDKGKPALISDFDPDHNRVLDGALPKVDTTGNANTALFDIVRKSVDEISGLEARRVLLLFSDGVDITSSTELDEVIREAQDAHVVINAVGMGSNMAPEQAGSRPLRRLAKETGGQYWPYQPGKQGIEEMNAFLDGLVAQRNLYRVSFTSTQCSGESKVRVIVEKDGIQREASQSYLVPELDPVISLENVTGGIPYSGKQSVKVSIVCSQYPVTKVEFRLNGRLVYTDNVSPFEFEWNAGNTAWELGATESEPKEVKISAVAYAGKHTVERSVTVAAALSLVPPPSSIAPSPTLALPSCSTGNRLNDFFCRLQHVDIGAWLGVISSLAVLGAVIWLVAWMKRNPLLTRGPRSSTVPYPDQSEFDSKVLAGLVVESEPHRDRFYEIAGKSTILGSHDKMADIAFGWDKYISRKHAEIVLRDGQFYIFDLMSRNKTWVNDDQVPPSKDNRNTRNAVHLEDGCQIKLGPQLMLRFRIGDGSGGNPPEPEARYYTQTESGGPEARYHPQTEPGDAEARYHPQTEPMEPSS